MLWQPGSQWADMVSTGSTFMYSYPLPSSGSKPKVMSGEVSTTRREELGGTKEDSAWECRPTLVSHWQLPSRVPCHQPPKELECVQDTLLNCLGDADRSLASNGEEQNEKLNDVYPPRQLNESDSLIAPGYELDERYKGVSGEPDACRGSGVKDNTSCFPHLDSEWRQGAARHPLHEILNEHTRKEQDVYHPHAMLSGHRSTPISPLESPEEAATAAWDIERDNEIFNFLCRSRRNLVLDSVYPHVTPHIVITPADETWNDYFIPLENRVDPQWPCYLMAAQFEASPAYHRLPIPSSDADQTSSNLSLMKTDNLSASHKSYEPKSVFSPSRFIQLIECSSTERLIMYHVITALQRHQCKAAAFAAARVAFSFRARYDSPDFVLALERPFRWSDPAEPLLLNSRYHLGTTIIDSVCPFLAPHIIINAPPPQNPWIAWQNATNDPQDRGYGRFLVVPTRSVTLVNDYAQDFESEIRPGPEVFELTADLFESLSRPETPTPETPLADGEEPKIFLSHDSCDDEEKSFPDDCSGPSLIELVIPLSDDHVHACSSHSSRPCSIFSEDEDEDDLPPFDEWYQTIVRSTQVAV